MKTKDILHASKLKTGFSSVVIMSIFSAADKKYRTDFFFCWVVYGARLNFKELIASRIHRPRVLDLQNARVL